MNKELYKPLAEKIYEMVPRLKELSFGCLIDVRIPFEDTGEEVCIDTYKSKEDVYVKTDYETYHEEEFAIIGHPITLESVLEAINKGGTQCKETGIKDSGRFIAPYLNNSKLENASWDYGKPLSEQSDEVGEFLSEILL